MASDPDEAWELVHEAILAFGLKVPDLGKARRKLLAVIRAEAWKRYTPPIGDPCAPPSFREWITAKVPRGLETTEDNLAQIAKGDTALENELDRLLQRPVGTNQHTQGVSNVNRRRPAGNTEGQALRKLRKGAPELHAEVLAGRLSAHAAMVKAGFRPRTISVPIDRPEAIARALRNHLDAERLAELRRLLDEEGQQ